MVLRGNMHIGIIAPRFLALLPMLLTLAACGPNADPAAVARGAQLFTDNCEICHRIDADLQSKSAATGPDMQGIVGRKAGTLTDYQYSPAMKAAPIIWDEPTLARFLKEPRAVVPQNQMGFFGLSDPQSIKDLTLFLQSRS